MTETGATSPDPKPAVEAQQEPDPHHPATHHQAPHDLDRRRHLARLRDLAGRLDHQAVLIRNSGRDPRAETRAGKLADEAFAIRWALRQLAPETECIRQTLDALSGAGGAGVTPRSRP
jgi:hypothetical protein